MTQTRSADRHYLIATAIRQNRAGHLTDLELIVRFGRIIATTECDCTECLPEAPCATCSGSGLVWSGPRGAGAGHPDPCPICT